MSNLNNFYLIYVKISSKLCVSFDTYYLLNIYNNAVARPSGSLGRASTALLLPISQAYTHLPT